MLLTLSTTHQPATDLGYLLHKNPSRPQVFELSFGRVHVFYPQVNDQQCTAAMLLDIDPVGLVRNRKGPAGEGFALEQYVNDRPYVASSYMTVAMGRIFGTALAGNCSEASGTGRQTTPVGNDRGGHPRTRWGGHSTKAL